MRTPTKKELKIILRAVQSATDIIGDVTENPYEPVMDKNRYLYNLHYTLSDTCVKLYEMIKEAKE